MTSRPDFGRHEIVHDGVKLTCRYIAPGLTLHDLVVIFADAYKKAEEEPGAYLAGNPAKWPNVAGVTAVTEAVLNAIYP